MEKHSFHRYFVDNGAGLWITEITGEQKLYKRRSHSSALNAAGPVDLSVKAVLCVVQNSASVQTLDALRQLEQGSTNSRVGSAQRAF